MLLCIAKLLDGAAQAREGSGNAPLSRAEYLADQRYRKAVEKFGRLTQYDVRRIVREELAAIQREQEIAEAEAELQEKIDGINIAVFHELFGE